VTECTCYLRACQLHERIIPKPRRPLTRAHSTMLNKWEANDFPPGKTRLTSDETRLLLDAWSILEEVNR